MTLKAIPGRNPETFVLFDQIRRAAISVEANIVEGYALQTTPQFRRHLRIALGSAAELQCLIGIAREMRYLGNHVTQKLDPVIDRTIGLIFGLIRKLESSHGNAR